MLGLALITVVIILSILPAIAGEEEDNLEQTESSLASRFTSNIENLSEAFSGIGDIIGDLTRETRCDIGALSTEAECVALDPNDPNHGPRTSEEVAREIRFQKQCFLAVNLLKVREQVAGLTSNKRVVTPTRYVSLEGHSPADNTSLIVSRPNIDLLLNIKPALLSYMVPQVRFYKVFGTEGLPTSQSQNEETHEVEFHFDTRITEGRLNQILTEHRGRAEGVGLTSFGWEFIGVNPAEVENNIKAELNLFFNNMHDFERERIGLDENGVERSYRFSDLIVPEYLWNRDWNAKYPGFDQSTRQYNPNFFRIKVVAGWAVPSVQFNGAGLGEFQNIYNETGMAAPFEDFLETIRLSKKVMYLNLIRHDIDFGESGTMQVKAQYQALVEGSFASEETDIINVPKGEDTTYASKRVEQYSDDIRRVQAASRQEEGCQLAGADGGLIKDDEELQQIERALNFRHGMQAQRLELLRARDRARAYHSIIEALTLSGKIYTLKVVPEDLGFASRTSDASFRRMVTNANEGLPELNELDPQVQARHVEAIRTGNPDAEIPDLPTPGLMEWVQGVMDPGFEFNPHSRVTPDAATLRRMIAISRMYLGRNFDVSVAGDISVSCAPSGDDLVNPHLENLLERQAEAEISVARDDRHWQSNLSARDMQRITENIIRWIERPYTESEWNENERPNMSLNFMFFGDLLDIVVGRVASTLSADVVSDTGLPNNIQIYLGTFPYNDLNSSRGTPGRELYLPLAHIPISMELFSVWFLEEIVQPNRTSMTLRGFIRSVFDKLIVNAFGTDCVLDPSGEDPFFLTQQHFSILPELYTIPRTRLEEAGMFGRGIPNFEQIGLVANHNDVLANLRRENALLLLDRDRDYSYNDYINVALYQAKSSDRASGTIRDTNLVEEAYLDVRDSDISKGIYHLNIGSQRGLIKSIKFSRIDQKYMREARIEAAGELGAFNQMRERYNATVAMYGNVFFYPGQYVFLNPSMVGLGTAVNLESLTTKMGIGGYFLITRVENIIESGMYETRLQCSWQYSGFRPMVVGETALCDPNDTRTFNSDDYTVPDPPSALGGLGEALGDVGQGISNLFERLGGD